MLQDGDQVVVTAYELTKAQYVGCIGIILAVYPANHVGDQRTMYDVKIADTILYLYENEVIPLYPTMGLH